MQTSCSPAAARMFRAGAANDAPLAGIKACLQVLQISLHMHQAANFQGTRGAS